MKVALAATDSSTRSALRMLLLAQSDMDCVGDVADIAGLAHIVQAHPPDVIVVDCDNLGDDQDMLIELVQSLRHVPMVGLSVHAESSQRALGANIDRFVRKEDPPDQLLSAIRALARVRMWD